jgi:GR25 family glycosyltransferase involved in LPS biosynthesis
MKNYVITLNTESKRYKDTSRHLRDYISYVPHIGVDGKKVSSKILNGMSPSIYGCYMAHVNAWKKCLNGPDKVCIILEDDVRVSVSKQYLHKALDSIDKNYKNFDLLVLGYDHDTSFKYLLSLFYFMKCRTKIKREYNDTIGTFKATDNPGFIGATAYALTKSGAKKLLDNISEPNGHVDVEMSCFANNINSFILKDRLFHQNTTIDQTLQNRSYVPKILDRIKLGDFSLAYTLSVLHCTKLHTRFYCISIFQAFISIIFMICILLLYEYFLSSYTTVINIR